MQISDFIQELQDIINEHGDMEINLTGTVTYDFKGKLQPFPEIEIGVWDYDRRRNARPYAQLRQRQRRKPRKDTQK